nr:hypothetical protein [Candidatus Sigynarchaeota archaeon]
INTDAPTRNPLTITASFNGTEEISSRPISGSSGAVYHDVIILSKANIIISSVTTNATFSLSQPNLWVLATIEICNLGSTPVTDGNASIFLNSTYAQTPIAVTPTTGLYVPAGGAITVQIRFFLSAATPNSTRILISGNFIGIETISGAVRVPVSIANMTLLVARKQVEVYFSIVGGRQYYVRSSDTFVVRVTINNVLGTTEVTNANVTLVFPSATGYSLNASSYTGLYVGIGSARFIDFLVNVTSAATLGNVSFYATFSANNPLLITKNTGTMSIVTQTQAIVSILSITYLTGNGTYVAGMSFSIRVTYRNTGGTAAINLATTLHFGSSIYSWNATGLITVLAGSTWYQDFEISVWVNSSATLDSVNASWTAAEQYSERVMNGGSGAISLPIRILAQANVSITGISYSAPNGFFNGSLFYVNVSISNTGGAKGTAILCTLLPSIAGYLSWLPPATITVIGGTTRYIIFSVYVSNTNVTLTLTASFTGIEEISSRPLSGNSSGIYYVDITIPLPSFVFISNVTIISPNTNATFNAGETFTVRVWFQNTGGLDGTVMTVNLIFPGYSFAKGSWTGTVVVPANGTIYIDLIVPISDAGTTQNVTGTITWSGRENNSNRAISGSSGAYEVEVHIIAIRRVNFFTVFLLVCGIAGIVLLGLVATRPKKIKEQIVPGKKKTCKQCGKYVKPYASTCPYCGYKLAEEETMADAMNKLSHLFIFHEESGVCLYYHAFTEAKIDPQLISGFLSAITSFGGQFDEATKKKTLAPGTAAKKTSDLKELVYKEYRILMETSGPCKFAVLITGQTSKILSFKISQFIKHFMRTYDEALKDWKGNVRIFKDVEKMVRLIFGLTKVQPEGAKPALPGKPAAEEGAMPTTGPKAPPPGYGSLPPQKPVKPVGPAPMKPTLPPSGQIAPIAAPLVQKPVSPTPQAQPSQQQPSSASSLFALKEQIGAPGEFTPAVPKEPAKPPSGPLGFSLPESKIEGKEDKKDKKDKKKGKK